ncbi:YigZ family protein [Leucothrix sargassi]|nr:YigZ family protein [Leucothrix sargassi]
MLTLRQPYMTLAEATEFEIEPIKNSRFIAYALPVETDEAAMAFIESIRVLSPDAGHHCWAYALRKELRVRFSDDGEPGGSAGQPMLRQLQGRDLHDLAVVVIRYSGGIKLGVGGLMRAYGGAVGQLLDRATLKTVTPKLPLWLEYDYADTTSVEISLASLELSPHETEYGERVRACLMIPDESVLDVYKALQTQAGGRITLTLPEALESEATSAG